MTGSVVMMPYQVYQLYQAERTKTAAEIRRADEQLGELSQAFSSAWQHAARPQGRRRADYLTGYHPSFTSGAPSAPSGRPEERAA
jgi:hypothetical protein